MSLSSVSPVEVIVRPRVVTADGTTMLLTDALEPWLSRSSGLIQLYGRSGSGKTTALRFLAQQPQFAGVQFLDEPNFPALVRALAVGPVAYTAEPQLQDAYELLGYLEGTHQRLHLARWNSDDLIEYLLGAYPNQCGQLLCRFLADPEHPRLNGLPRLCAWVLDGFALDENAVRIAEVVLHGAFASVSPQTRRAIGLACHCSLINGPPARFSEDLVRLMDEFELPVLRHAVIRTWITSDYVAEALRRGDDKALEVPLSEEILQAVAERLQHDSDVWQVLASRFPQANWEMQPSAAGLLHAAQIDWQPPAGRRINLTDAHLRAVNWPQVNLSGGRLHHAHFAGSNLERADLRDAQAEAIELSQCNLRGANLEKLWAPLADFSRADCSDATATHASLMSSNLAEADFSRAKLFGSLLDECDLRDARFCQADLTRVILKAAQIDGTDFSDANFSEARLHGLDMRTARWNGACFPRAVLRDCNLEDLTLLDADFRGADMGGALLTGSNLPRARFDNARLRQACLAEINWEEADLEGADLRQSTFHMGSTRSGLLFSPIASEGTRTGFYTDDYHDQDHLAPEEIRKANLCGANLYGANVTGVDFYLVDLRGARYDARQADHFRRCGAILCDRGG